MDFSARRQVQQGDPQGAQGEPQPQAVALDKALLAEAQTAVLELMRRPQSPLILDGEGADAKGGQADQEFRTAIAQVVGKRYPEMRPDSRLKLIDQLQHEMRGFGPLEPLLQQGHLYEDIMVNRFDRVFVVPVGGEPHLTEVKFRDDAHVRFVAARLLSSVRRRVTEADPMVDASLPGGLRVNVIMAPVAVEGTSMTIRIHHPFKEPRDLVGNGTITDEAMLTLLSLVAGHCNILVTGGTGSGKTTLLNVVSNYVPSWARIVTVEDAAELQIRDGNVVRLETRLPNIEGKGEITIRHLVRNAMRMRPDWIIIGEMRGAEALDVLTAGNSGHCVYSTMHANSAEGALFKLATYAAMSEEHLSEVALSYQVAAAFHVVVHMARQGSQRRVIQIAEVTGVDPDTQMILTQDIFRLKDGHLVPTGNRPNRWIAALQQQRFPVPGCWVGEVEA